MKKRKKEILLNKEQSTEQSTVQSTVQPTEQSTEHPPVQPTVQSKNTYVYSIGILAVLTIGVFLYIILLRLETKNKSMKNNHQSDVMCFRKIYNK